MIFLLPRGVTVAQMTLDHFVMVRIHARQPKFFGIEILHKSLISTGFLKIIILKSKNEKRNLMLKSNLSREKAEAIAENLFKGNKIEAIKLYREFTDGDLKDAKQAIDQYEKELRSISPEKFVVPPGGKGCAGLLVIIFCLVFFLIQNN